MSKKKKAKSRANRKLAREARRIVGKQMDIIEEARAIAEKEGAGAVEGDVQQAVESEVMQVTEEKESKEYTEDNAVSTEQKNSIEAKVVDGVKSITANVAGDENDITVKELDEEGEEEVMQGYTAAMGNVAIDDISLWGNGEFRDPYKTLVADLMEQESAGNTKSLNILGYIGDISDTASVARSIGWLTGRKVDVEKINTYCETSKRRYLKETGTEIIGLNAQRQAHFMLVDLGMKNIVTKKDLYASFRRGKVGWEGAYIGSFDTIVDRIHAFLNGNGVYESAELSDVKSTIQAMTKDEYESLLETSYPEEYAAGIERGLLDDGEGEQKEGTADNAGVADGETPKSQEPVKKTRGRKKKVEEPQGEGASADANADAGEPVKKTRGRKKKTEEPAPEKETDEQSEKLEDATNGVTDEDKPFILCPKLDLNKKAEMGEFEQSLYNALRYKEYWGVALDEVGGNRLSFYIDCIWKKVRRNIGSKVPVKNGCIEAKKDKLVCFNTNLLDNFMNYIYVIAEYYEARNKKGELELQFSKPRVAGGKMSLLQAGFTADEIVNMPGPVRFSSAEKYEFKGSLNNFDFNNRLALNHILNERRYRLSEDVQEMPDDILSDRIRSSVVAAIKMNSIDRNYVLPMYHKESDSIQYLVPLYLKDSYGEIPDAVGIVGESCGYYSLKTILTVNMAYSNARVISPVRSDWLRLE